MKFLTAFLIASLIIQSLPLLSQEKIPRTDYLKFELKLETDSIDFIVTERDSTEKKPIFLFCQGSQPVPLVLDITEDYKHITSVSNFDIEEIKKHYHVVMISMPKTPLIASLDQLNKSYCYVTDTSRQHSYSIDYVKANYLENYVNRASEVLKFLKTQDWVDHSKLVVAGHSQGSRVAVEVADRNDDVTHLGLFGYNPNGRIDQMIHSARNRAGAGEITWEEADSIQQYYYDLYESSLDDEVLKERPELMAWRTFSKPSINELVELEVPVYIAYGAEDEIAQMVDLLPIRFIDAGKSNYEIHRYPDLEHNFFPVVDGKVDHKNARFPEVMNQFVTSTLE